MKTKCCDSSEFRGGKGNKSKSANWAFGLKLSNRFEVLLSDNVTSITSGTNGVKETRRNNPKQEVPLESVEKNKNLSTTCTRIHQIDEKNGAAAETVDSQATDVYQSNKVLKHFLCRKVLFLTNCRNLRIKSQLNISQR